MYVCMYVFMFFMSVIIIREWSVVRHRSKSGLPWSLKILESRTGIGKSKFQALESP